METIFKVRTSIPGGIFVDGHLITERWSEFQSTSLFESCSKNPNLEMNVFKNGKYEVVKDIERQAKADKMDKKAFVEKATIADLKVYLIEEKGYEKKDLADLNKPDLIELVLAD